MHIDKDGLELLERIERAKNIVFFTGAGVSTDAGIPDFRGKLGIYSSQTLQSDNKLPNEAIFQSSFFLKDQEPLFRLIKSIIPPTVKPTSFHCMLKVLDDLGKLRRVYTQNVDSLESLTGLKPERVVNAHGSIKESTCIDCKAKYNFEWLLAQLYIEESKRSDSSKIAPKCEACNGIIKPNIVLFDDPLPGNIFENLAGDIQACDLAIIAGTSLSVKPFSMIINYLLPTTCRFLVNNVEITNGNISDTECFYEHDFGQKSLDYFWNTSMQNFVSKIANKLDSVERLKKVEDDSESLKVL
ncbi:MAG: NAD-dependent protein deacetylase sirtuin-2 [Marteilia pararefringens]